LILDLVVKSKSKLGLESNLVLELKLKQNKKKIENISFGKKEWKWRLFRGSLEIYH
jgi:hypothetical protein